MDAYLAKKKDKIHEKKKRVHPRKNKKEKDLWQFCSRSGKKVRKWEEKDIEKQKRNNNSR